MNLESEKYANPVVVEFRRGGAPEAWHRGAWCVRRNGAALAAAGDVDRLYFMRSASKFFQAVPTVLAGAAERFGLGDREIALMCASHGGEPDHVETVRGMLDRAGLGADDLACGAHAPLYGPAAAALRERGQRPTRLHNNCSGKHAGMMLGALAMGAPTSNYVDPAHPIQRAIVDLVRDLGEVGGDAFEVMIDGCSAPTFRTSLLHAATAFENFAAPKRRMGAAFAAAAHRIVGALEREPRMIAGTDRFCTTVIEATRGRVFAKVGADGFYGAFAPKDGIGIALHIDDGNWSASERLLTALLDALGLVDERAKAALARFDERVRRNHAGLVVGDVQVSLPGF